MRIHPHRNVVQRALNRAGHRFGIKPFPVAFVSTLPEVGGGDVFDAIYAANYWKSEESRSGTGSTVAATARYRPQLVEWIKRLGIRSMFDAPCGDLNWMRLVLDQVDIAYIGGDIAEAAVESARARCPELDVRRFDLTADDFPAADLWHCRDTFFHLSFADIARALTRARRADVRFAAITTHKSRMLRNLDIETGGFRLLDLERPPFSFPPAVAYLRDFEPGDFPRYVGIWRMGQL